MQFPLGTRHISITLERVARVAMDRPELIEASDRDIERLARSSRTAHEPRWDAHSLMLGVRPH